MGFLTALYQTYEQAERDGLVDKHEGQNTVLLPIYHSSLKSDGNNIIRVSLTKNSDLVNAEFVPQDQVIVFPVTEESAGRTSSNCPHPLVDKMSYIIPKGEKQNIIYHEGLDDWYNNTTDKYAREYLSIIRKYLESNNLFKDILSKLFGDSYYRIGDGKDADKIFYDEDGKEKNFKWRDCFLTFSVIAFEDQTNVNVTNSKKIHEAYIRYIDSLEYPKALCNISGKFERVCQKHRGLLGNAKLVSVSSNKETYYGRFKDRNDIITIGYPTSEKIHLMLKYLRENSNTCRQLSGNQFIVNWLSNDLLSEDKLDLSIENPFNSFFYEEKIKKQPIVSKRNFNLSQAFVTGQLKFDPNQDYYVAIIDKASNGRISLKYFNNLKLSKLMENLLNWEKQYYWYRWNKENETRESFTPSIYNILNVAYGVEREGRIELGNDKFKKDQMSKMIISLIEGRSLPQNIINSIFINSKGRLRYKKQFNNVLTIALAICKSLTKEEYNDMLKQEVTNRSYLFGRLLAIYEMIESATYSLGEQDRVTNAEKYWTAYIQNPKTTMLVLERNTNSYKNKLQSNPTKRGLAIKYDREKNIICSLLDQHYFGTVEENKALSADFLYGYYAEKNYLFSRNEVENKFEKVEEEVND